MAHAAHVRSPCVAGWTLPIADGVWSRIARDFGLSRREAEVVRCVLNNLDVRHVAARFAISERTVRAHLEHVYRKLEVRNRSDLILFVFADVLERGLS